MFSTMLLCGAGSIANDPDILPRSAQCRNEHGRAGAQNEKGRVSMSRLGYGRTVGKAATCQVSASAGTTKRTTRQEGCEGLEQKRNVSGRRRK